MVGAVFERFGEEELAEFITLGSSDGSTVLSDFDDGAVENITLRS